MPRHDRTGPEGQGSLTGRKLGKCNTNSTENNSVLNECSPRGRGMRHGRGKSAEFGKGRGLGSSRS